MVPVLVTLANQADFVSATWDLYTKAAQQEGFDKRQRPLFSSLKKFFKVYFKIVSKPDSGLVVHRTWALIKKYGPYKTETDGSETAKKNYLSLDAAMMHIISKLSKQDAYLTELCESI